MAWVAGRLTMRKVPWSTCDRLAIDQFRRLNTRILPSQQHVPRGWRTTWPWKSSRAYFSGRDPRSWRSARTRGGPSGHGGSSNNRKAGSYHSKGLRDDTYVLANRLAYVPTSSSVAFNRARATQTEISSASATVRPLTSRRTSSASIPTQSASPEVRRSRLDSSIRP